VFAEVRWPSGLLYIPHLDLVAVGSLDDKWCGSTEYCGGRVFFFLLAAASFPSVACTDPCECDEDGIVGGVDTGEAGCKLHQVGWDAYCYVSDACTAYESVTTANDKKWRYCDPATDFVAPLENLCPRGSTNCPCLRGTHSPSGSALDGLCPNNCPAHFPDSNRGATSVSDCFNHGGNVIVACGDADRVAELNAGADTYDEVTSGLPLNYPNSIVCVDEIACLVSSYYTHEIQVVSTEGKHLGVFAEVLNPYGLLYIPHLDLRSAR
jgi:hypothetical protein